MDVGIGGIVITFITITTTTRITRIIRIIRIIRITRITRIMLGIMPDIMGIIKMRPLEVMGNGNDFWISHTIRQGRLRPPFAFIGTRPLILIILILNQKPE
jgi:hypothetical protein